MKRHLSHLHKGHGLVFIVWRAHTVEITQRCRNVAAWATGVDGTQEELRSAHGMKNNNHNNITIDQHKNGYQDNQCARGTLITVLWQESMPTCIHTRALNEGIEQPGSNLALAPVSE